MINRERGSKHFRTCTSFLFEQSCSTAGQPERKGRVKKGVIHKTFQSLFDESDDSVPLNKIKKYPLAERNSVNVMETN